MKKVTPTVSNEKKVIKNTLKPGKIIKSKPKNLKKLKDAVTKTAVPKIETRITGAGQNPKSNITKSKKKVQNNETKSENKVQNNVTKSENKVQNNVTKSENKVQNNATKSENKVQNNVTKSKKKVQNNVSKSKKVQNNVTKSENKVQNNVTKSENKVKNNVTKSEKKVQNNVTKSENKVQNSVAKSENKVQNVNKKQQKVVKKIKQDEKKSSTNKVKKEKLAKTSPVESKDDNGFTAADLKKIDKKKAKKLVQKLKKQQKKKEPLPWVTSTVNGGLKETKLKTEGKTSVDTVNNDIESTNSKVLAKKDKKAIVRQQIKDKKLEERQTRDPAVEAATIFVGNLPTNTKRVQIIRLFKNYGPINSIRLRSAGGKVLHKHKQRREAGSLNAYLVLKDKATADKSLSLNGVEFKGNHLRVTSSLKTPQSHEKEEAKRTVFVGNLKYTATEETLREIFTSCGEIDYVRCIRDGDKGCKGVAYVCFKTADAVGLALELNETILDERPINVERFTVKKLGAKSARDAQAEKGLKSKMGAKQRIDGKKPKQNKPVNKKISISDINSDKKPKKNEFKGVKVDALKKKLNLKKKKSNNQMLQLAKKIAPKPKTE